MDERPDVDGRRIVVCFSVEDSGEHLIWGTAVMRAGELHLATDESDVLLPLTGGLERLRSADRFSFAEDAEWFTLVHVGRRPEDVSPEDCVRTGLRFDDS